MPHILTALCRFLVADQHGYGIRWSAMLEIEHVSDEENHAITSITSLSLQLEKTECDHQDVRSAVRATAGQGISTDPLRRYYI